MSEESQAFYRAWAELLGWLREYADGRPDVEFVKQADFTDYIYRMEREYDLPTTIQSASLSVPGGSPVLFVSASMRFATFKEVTLHPFDSHVYRSLALAKDGEGLAEGPRRFTKEMLFALADRLFEVAVA